MRIGILADIHEAVELLEVAIGRLTGEGVDQFLVLGDVFETGPRLDETIMLLESVGAVGVYGNHDYGLSVDPSPYVLERYSRRVVDYMMTLLLRMELGDSFFAHREPSLDCSDIHQIWHVDDTSLPTEAIAKSFESVPDRPAFIGHFHRWQAFSREGPLAWEGQGPLIFPAQRPILVVVAAVCDGHAAILETEAGVLTPVDLYRDRPRPDRRPLPRLVHE